MKVLNNHDDDTCQFCGAKNAGHYSLVGTVCKDCVNKLTDMYLEWKEQNPDREITFRERNTIYNQLRKQTKKVEVAKQ